MRFSLLFTGLLLSWAVAQTPLEFGIVQDLVGGTPRVSVYSIKTVSEQGVRTLQIAARSGIQFNCTRHTMLADSLTGSEVMIRGQVSYSASIMTPLIEHFFSTIRENMAVHGSGGIEQFQVDLITADEMGWISVTVPLARVDSLLQGSLDHLSFWAMTPVREVEVGTLGFPVANESPLPELRGAPALPEVVQTAIREENCAWKSLLLPGWGQACSGRGLPLVNILAEAAGAA